MLAMHAGSLFAAPGPGALLLLAPGQGTLAYLLTRSIDRSIEDGDAHGSPGCDTPGDL